MAIPKLLWQSSVVLFFGLADINDAAPGARIQIFVVLPTQKESLIFLFIKVFLFSVYLEGSVSSEIVSLGASWSLFSTLNLSFQLFLAMPAEDQLGARFRRVNYPTFKKVAFVG